MKNLFHYIGKKNLLKMLSIVTLQQALTAYGTYALVRAGQCIEHRSLFFIWALVSISIYLLTPALGVLIRSLESLLSFRAYSIFIQEAVFSKSGATSIWQNKVQRNHFLSSIGTDAQDYLGLMLFVTMDIYSFSLSVIFGVLVLGFTIDVSLIFAFAVSAAIGFLIYKKLSPIIEHKFCKEQKSRSDLLGHLLKSWDYVFLKNPSVQRAYSEMYENKLNLASSATIMSAANSEGLVFVLGLATGLPIVVSFAWILLHASGANQTSTFIALLATLPKQMNILTVFRNIFQSLTSLMSLRSKFDVLRNGTIIQDRDLTTSIKTELIQLNKNSVNDVETLIEQISTAPKGRFEIRGPNGSGKSSLLLHLNKSLPSSFYLPTHPNLILTSSSIETQSTGESLKAHFELIENAPEKVILLDEWDANLDIENLQALELKLQNLSKKKTIVEVRHR